jgi:hypothetical protein
MDDLEQALRHETEKWIAKMKDEISHIELLDKEKEHMVTNIKAYVKDSETFLKQEKLVMAFEAVIWSWAIFETLRDLKIINTRLQP